MSGWLIRDFRRGIEFERNRGGMNAGMPSVRVDASRLWRLCDECEAQADEIQRLRREVEALRLHGDKDCTAMADEALAQREAI